jgi:hypothetical protein
VKMKKDANVAKTILPKQFITGTVTRDGRPVKTGWVGLWYVRRDFNAMNAPILRGRTAELQPFVLGSALVVDGKYRLEVPFEGGYLVVEELGQPLTQVGPLAVKLREEKKLDIACVQGGTISGTVKNVPAGWEGHLWAIAFTKTGIRAEMRVTSDGTFRLEHLPPGEYGVKVGHDAYLDAEVPRGSKMTEADEKRPADGWKTARRVRVEPGHVSGGVELELPPSAEFPKEEKSNADVKE